MTAGATDRSNNRTTGTIGFNNVKVIYVSNKLTGTIYCTYKSNWRYYCSQVEKMPENLLDTWHGNVYLFVTFPYMILYGLDSTAVLVSPTGSISHSYFAFAITGFRDVPQAHSHLKAFPLPVFSVWNAIPPDMNTAHPLPLGVCSNVIL